MPNHRCVVSPVPEHACCSFCCCFPAGHAGSREAPQALTPLVQMHRSSSASQTPRHTTPARQACADLDGIVTVATACKKGCNTPAATIPSRTDGRPNMSDSGRRGDGTHALGEIMHSTTRRPRESNARSQGTHRHPHRLVTQHRCCQGVIDIASLTHTQQYLLPEWSLSGPKTNPAATPSPTPPLFVPPQQKKKTRRQKKTPKIVKKWLAPRSRVWRGRAPFRNLAPIHPNRQFTPSPPSTNPKRPLRMCSLPIT